MVAMPGPRRSLAPLAIATLTALVSCLLLAVAVGAGWLGEDVGRGDQFCEAARPGPIRQPANTWSNLGFVVAGLAIAWRAGDRSRLGATMERRPGLATGLACVVVLLGPASAAMHAAGSAFGGDLDLLSMYLLAGFVAAYAVTRYLGRDQVFFWQTYLLAVAACQLIGRFGGAVPVVQHAGNLAFAALLALGLGFEVALWRQGRLRVDLRHGAIAVVVLLVAFGIWLLSNAGWCDPHSLLQGHAVWHLLCAVAAYQLFLGYAGEREASA